MRPREEILRNALEDIKNGTIQLEKAKTGAKYEKRMSRLGMQNRAALAIISASKAGPSEEDKKWLNEVEANLYGDAVDTLDAETRIAAMIIDLEVAISKLKQTWGMK